VGALNL